MISLINHKPDCFNHLNYTHNYYELKDDNGIYGYMALLFVMGEGAVHLNIIRWSAGAAKDMIASVPQLIKIAQENGAKRLVGINPDPEDKRWGKMLRLVGFEPPKLMQVSYKEI